MRTIAFLLLGFAACKSGHRQGRLVAKLEGKDTPASLVPWRGKLLIQRLHSNDAHQVDTEGLFELDPGTGDVHELAPTLLMGKLAVHGDAICYGDYQGEVGTINPTSGAFRIDTKIDQSIDSLACVDDGTLVGTTQKLVKIDAAKRLNEIATPRIEPAASTFDKISASATGVFAASSGSGMIVRVDRDRAVPIADHQTQPHDLTAGDGRVVWIAGTTKVMSTSPVGGVPAVLATAPQGANIQTVAADGRYVVYSVVYERDRNGEIYVIEGDGQPRLLVNQAGFLITIVGAAAYFLVDAPGGDEVFGAPL